MSKLTWESLLAEEMEKDYYLQITSKLTQEREQGRLIFPPQNLIFNAFLLTPFHQIKVVIIGQDPYHNDGQAHGLSFSVPKGIKPPPSLKNIFQELKSDCNILEPLHGNLTSWTHQGVLLLNSFLTVRAHEPASHQNLGWQTLTDTCIRLISEHQQHIVFMLWGNFAHQKEQLIDAKKHLVLKAPHPSPFSARKGFYGCKHFSKANTYLIENGCAAIDWTVA